MGKDCVCQFAGFISETSLQILIKSDIGSLYYMLHECSVLIYWCNALIYLKFTSNFNFSHKWLKGTQDIHLNKGYTTLVLSMI